MEKLNVLLLGSGGRESALAFKISQSPLLSKLIIAPGNPGMAQYGTLAAVKATDFDALEQIVRQENIHLVVVGPEEPLVKGVRERLAATGVAVLGPGADGARLEGSKDFAKEFMQRHGIPTAAYRTFTQDTLKAGCDFLATLQAPYVLKADGLAAGKGVLIEPTLKSACNALGTMLAGQFGSASERVVIEEYLSGIECSVFVLTDGAGHYRILPPAKDYKRVFDGDEGLNTGGMGAVCPPPFADTRFMERVENEIVIPTVKGLIADGIDYRGFIFLGLMNTAEGPKVIEYNVRMGDPETEAVMPRIQSDVLELMWQAARGELTAGELDVDPRVAVTVMAVSGGYPGSYPKGLPISGNLTPDKSIVFHAGTAMDGNGRLVTAGGRVLTVTTLAPTLTEAVQGSYAALAEISFDGMHFRTDITKDLL